MTERRATIMKLRPECVDAYVEYHRHVWPELEAVYHRAGVRDITCYLHDTTLVVTMEIPGDVDPATLEAMRNDPVERKWQAEMAKLWDGTFKPVTLREVYRLPPA